MRVTIVSIYLIEVTENELQVFHNRQVSGGHEKHFLLSSHVKLISYWNLMLLGSHCCPNLQFVLNLVLMTSDYPCVKANKVKVVPKKVNVACKGYYNVRHET